MPSIATSRTIVRTRHSLEIVGDTKRCVEGAVDALRYAGIVTPTCTVVLTRDRQAQLSHAMITTDYALTNAQIQQIRSW